METKKQVNNNITNFPRIDIQKQINKEDEVIDSLPDNKKQEVKKIVTGYREFFSGPIPHPTILQGYDNIKKGFAERIVKMAEKEQNAVISQSEKIIKYQARDSLFGIMFAFIIIIGFGIIGFILIMNDKNVAGFTTMVGAFAGWAFIFANGKKNNTKDKNI